MTEEIKLEFKVMVLYRLVFIQTFLPHTVKMDECQLSMRLLHIIC